MSTDVREGCVYCKERNMNKYEYTNTCENCPKDCKTCDSYNPKKCKYCKSGKYKMTYAAGSGDKSGT